MEKSIRSGIDDQDMFYPVVIKGQFKYLQQTISGMDKDFDAVIQDIAQSQAGDLLALWEAAIKQQLEVEYSPAKNDARQISRQLLNQLQTRILGMIEQRRLAIEEMHELFTDGVLSILHNSMTEVGLGDKLTGRSETERS